MRSDGKLSEPTDRALLQAELEQRVEWARSHGHLYPLAVWQLVCGRAGDGLQTLRELVSTSDASGAPADPRWAMVAGDRAGARGIAREALRAPTQPYVAGYGEYIRALYALVAGETASAAQNLDDLRRDAAASAWRRRHTPAGAVDLIEGFLSRSVDVLERGLDALLAWHLRRARARGEIFNSADAVVSLDAAAALLLAKRQGLTPAVARDYRAASVPLLVIHVSEWQGELLTRPMTLRLDADLVAGDWLRLHGLEVPVRGADT